GRGWLSGDSGEPQEYVADVLQMWHDRRKDTFGSCSFLPTLRARDGSRPERGDQYYEIGAAISGLKNPGCPRFQSGEQSPLGSLLSLSLQVVRGLDPGTAGLVLITQPVVQALFAAVRR